MFIASILIRATALVVVGFFVLFAASRTEGNLKAFGKYLALWLFVLPVLLILLAALSPRQNGHGGFGMHGGHMHRMGMMHGGSWAQGDHAQPFMFLHRHSDVRQPATGAPAAGQEMPNGAAQSGAGGGK